MEWLIPAYTPSFVSESDSLNDGIPRKLSTVQYASIQTDINHVLNLRKDVYLAKTYLADAFSLLPVHPYEYPRLGMQVNGQFYYDHVLPMGCSRSCTLYEEFARALEWIAIRNSTNVKICHVLDDSIFLFHPGSKNVPWVCRASTKYVK